MLRRLALALLAGAPLPALANDSTAELSTGGLILSRNDTVSMESENLYISPDKVTVDYVFRNRSDEDVETVVAFPMPDVEGNPFWMPAIPQDTHDNFLGFEVSIDGKDVKPELEHKAFAVGLDIGAELTAHNVPLNPFLDSARAELAKLPQAVADDWLRRGIIVIEEYDDGSGMKKVRSPYWQLKSTYWWRTVFPANKDVKVSHRYQPSVGATAGLSFFSEGKLAGYSYAEYKHKYCMDDGFERAVLKNARESPEGYPRLYETRISYVLRTGGNWATGTIGKFKLTVDKGKADSLVSFCGDGVEKTGPTTFQMTEADFYPERDLHILILERYDDIPGDADDPTADRSGPVPGNQQPPAGSSGSGGR